MFLKPKMFGNSRYSIMNYDSWQKMLRYSGCKKTTYLRYLLLVSYHLPATVRFGWSRRKYKTLKMEF